MGEYPYEPFYVVQNHDVLLAAVDKDVHNICLFVAQLYQAVQITSKAYKMEKGIFGKSKDFGENVLEFPKFLDDVAVQGYLEIQKLIALINSPCRDN